MRRTEAIHRVVIIGGGISGLSSAFYLRQIAERQGKTVELTLVDEAPELGGKINTLHRDGFVIEKGPDSFLARKRAIIDLAKELGIDDELTATNPAAKKTYIMHRRKLFPMPPGMMLGIPTELGPFMKNGLISWGGKLRAALDLLLPARPAAGDESLGGFLERRVGTEVMRRIAEPLLAGIYAGDLKKLSLQATFPQFAESEKKHGSLIKGMMANRKAAAAATDARAGGGVFMTFKGGLTTMVSALDESLDNVERRLGVKAVGIERAAEQPAIAGGMNGEQSAGTAAEKAQRAAASDGREWSGDQAAQTGSGRLAGGDAPYIVTLSSGERLQADQIVVTAPAFAAAELLEPLMACDELRSIRYVSVANVVLAFDKAAFGLEFDGSGFVVPRSEGLHITACTWTSSKWLHSSPEDKVLLRCYVGHSEDQESVKLPDDKLIEAVRSDIRETMGITAEPLFVEITRLNHSMPQYPVGHVENMKRLRDRAAAELPGVWVTGAAFDGVGLPDCIRQGKEAAEALLG